MTEHGWPDHHDDPQHFDPQHYDPQHFDDTHDVEPPPPAADDDHDLWDPQHDHDHDLGKSDDELHDLPYEHHTEHTVTTDEPAAEHTAPAEEITDTVFPPAVDVGPLPEPVDGFPWIDPATLGDPSAALTDLSPTDPADPSDLTAYAALDPGADPAASDDPANAALAKFWELG
jgi:hypothetical protein